jgi:hypothetical protein
MGLFLRGVFFVPPLIPFRDFRFNVRGEVLFTVRFPLVLQGSGALALMAGEA